MRHLLVTLFICLNGLVFSQKIHFGPEIGFNAISIEKSDLSKDFQPGWYAGLIFEYDFYNQFAIKTGINYSQKRQEFTTIDTTDVLASIGSLGDLAGFDFEGLDVDFLNLDSYKTTTGRQAQHYFEIPIMAEFKYKSLRLYGGGYLGFMFGARAKLKEVVNTPLTQTIDLSTFDSSGFITLFIPPGYQEDFSETSARTNLRVFDYGIKAGLGYEMNNLGIHVAYQYGIPDYRKKREDNPLQNHQFFQLSLNYMFHYDKGSKSISRL